jgi:hypothetical protein
MPDEPKPGVRMVGWRCTKCSRIHKSLTRWHRPHEPGDPIGSQGLCSFKTHDMIPLLDGPALVAWLRGIPCSCKHIDYHDCGCRNRKELADEIEAEMKK